MLGAAHWPLLCSAPRPALLSLKPTPPWSPPSGPASRWQCHSNGRVPDHMGHTDQQEQICPRVQHPGALRGHGGVRPWRQAGRPCDRCALSLESSPGCAQTLGPPPAGCGRLEAEKPGKPGDRHVRRGWGYHAAAGGDWRGARATPSLRTGLRDSRTRQNPNRSFVFLNQTLYFHITSAKNPKHVNDTINAAMKSVTHYSEPQKVDRRSGPHISRRGFSKLPLVFGKTSMDVNAPRAHRAPAHARPVGAWCRPQAETSARVPPGRRLCRVGRRPSRTG